MYELIRISEHDYYIDCPARVGLVRVGENGVLAIDGGSDKDAAKKVLRHIEANGWTLTAILNTHSHADHTGGNKFLQDRTGCKVYAAGTEQLFTAHPALEPMLLYGGLPFRDIENKFLMAPPSDALPLTQDVLPEGMTLLPLPGHSFDQVGFRTADGNVFLGDCLSSAETLRKYGICYLWDPGAFLETLETVKTMEAQWFIPAHVPATREIAEPAQINIDAVRGTAELLLRLLQTPMSFEELLKAVFESYGLTMNAQQYVLIGSTLRSYLSWLYSEGKAEFSCRDNRMLWQAK